MKIPTICNIIIYHLFYRLSYAAASVFFCIALPDRSSHEFSGGQKIYEKQYLKIIDVLLCDY